MDITILFKACVKTVKATNKAVGASDPKHGILKASPKDSNLVKAKEIIKHLSTLHQFFLENRSAYLNVVNYLSTNKTMSEADRDKIDNMYQTTISTCTTMINECKQNLMRQSLSQQKHEHYGNVLESLEAYLKTVSRLYVEAKAIRVKKVIETHKLSRLENISSPRAADSKVTNRDASRSLDQVPLPVENIELSPEEIQMFESENEHLYSELNSLSDEVKQIESKVVHIAELQELFTDKVLQQEKDIERIATTVVGSTENMKLANEQIRQAMQRNAGLRVWVLFFLLVMSFSLLFLDWYNE